MDIVIAACLGIGLAAACGFRVFVPLLVASVSVAAGWATPAADFAWLGTTPAMLVLAIATALELGAFYVPWLDNLLDSVASPAAVVAGTLVTAGFFADVDPLLRWSTAVIAGGGVAGGVQSLTVLTRAASSVMTGGLANPVVSTGEAVASLVLAVLAVVLPVVAVVLAVFFVTWAATRVSRARAAAP